MNRSHLKMFSNKDLLGKEYVQHQKINQLIDILTTIVLSILTGMILLIILSTILFDEPPKRNNKKIK
jgi:lipopolysaccharide/colanic/teichoic acid biosynthesis glycosyltransferase